ncbi:acyltransferase family protein [Priestia megaterium]|uniref:acyltransferase family protein n=1 Tax=Priestia megaterium TaxID=1404 RepID=UPI00203AC069|nr:acyltransferase family protein [Priestia megaterium]MCM3181906.1 acyltransferase family protein [Priestia megaterium]
MLNNINREKWLDIAKGIGIVLILIDHSQNFLSSYVSWFHLTIFFVVSGYLFKPINGIEDLIAWIKRRTIVLLVPYFSFLLCITLYRYVIEILKGNHNIAWFVKDFIAKIYGGQYLTGDYAPFWFITCLLGTQIIFAIIHTLIRSKKVQIAIVLFFYILSHVESMLVHNKTIMFYVPLAADVILITVAYYAFGFYCKKLLASIPMYIQIFSLGLSIAFVVLQAKERLGFQFELKYVAYSNLILDFVIPISFTLVFLGISQMLTKLKFTSSALSMLGMTSLTIMYLHFPLNLFIKNFVTYPSIVFILIGLIIPLTFEKILLQRNLLLRFLFLGKVKNKRPANVDDKKQVTTII